MQDCTKTDYMYVIEPPVILLFCINLVSLLCIYCIPSIKQDKSGISLNRWPKKPVPRQRQLHHTAGVLSNFNWLGKWSQDGGETVETFVLI